MLWPITDGGRCRSTRWQLRGAGEQRLGRDADAGRDRPAQVVAVRRNRVEGGGRAEVDDAGRPAVKMFDRRGVGHPVGADGLRIVDADAHAGFDARANHQRLLSQIAPAGFLDLAGERRHDGRQADACQAAEVDAVVGQQAEKLQAILVRHAFV